MKLKFIVLFWIAFLGLSELHAQNVTWAKRVGGSASDHAQSIAVDDSGNVYITGSFWGTADFNPGSATFNLTAQGGPDIFIQKLDVNGNLVWVKQIGSAEPDYGMEITLDAQANVYVTGHFGGTADFDPGPGVSQLSSPGISSVFILKLDRNGDFAWARSMGTSFEQGYSIGVDASGNVYTTGEFLFTVDFDPGPGSFNLTAFGPTDVFIHKMDANGNFLWVKQIGGALNTRSYVMDLDALGNIYIAGEFHGTVDFDPGAGVINLTSYGGSDAFILKLDQNGNYVWARQVGSGNTIHGDVGYGINVDVSGNVLVTGNFIGTADFDPGPAVFNLSSAGETDAFVLKLDNNGDFLWAKRAGGPSWERAFAVTTDVAGNVYVSGEFGGTANFNPGNAAVNLTAAGSSDAFLLKLDPNGNFIRVKQAGGTGIDWSTFVLVDTAGNIYSTGVFENTIYFFPGPGSVFFTSAGSFDFFVQKLSQCNTMPAVDVKTACNSYTWIDGNTYTASNNTATFTLLNAAGCDSVITLNLTINATSGIDTVIACDSFTWIDGNTYTISNTTATHTLTNAAGCDSVITLNLTIGANAAIDTVVACGSYTWIDGNTYIASNNTATHTLTNAAGCDSIVTLNLTINGVADLSTSLAGATISANNTNATAYQWLDCNNNYSAFTNETGISFTVVANGSYAVAITENGCTDTSACVSINTLSIDGTENGIEVISYPNPSGGNVYITLGQEMKNVRLTLMSADGKVLYSRLYKSLSNTALSLGAYSGVFFLNIETEKVKRTIRLLRE